ncbi:MAG: putative fatty-acid--CoA ligase [Acidimicrobiales bacterium]|nr:putative fatty-acid--CoA ligase [Acidimicrobiales bacterium]
MQPGDHVVTKGDHAAVVMANSGITVTYAELDDRSKRLAQLLRAAGLRPGDHVAILLENHPRYFEIFWAAMRAGLYCTPISWHLKPAEAGYIVADCGAAAVFTSIAMASVAADLEPFMGDVRLRLVVDGDLDGWDRYEDAVAAYPAEPLEDDAEGMFMFYSSGTTGRPKGIKPPLAGKPFGEGRSALVELIQGLFGFTGDSRYLCPAPLYHAAPLGWSTAVQRLGGTVVVMESFDAQEALELIEEHRITHAQFVPTHFVRMLRLDEVARTRPDLSSLQAVIHAAAPCPIEAKRQMLAWWGPIIHEYYSGSEGSGFCAVGPEDWTTHPGTVGRALVGTVHVLDAMGNEVPQGDIGQIWFESNVRFEYHNDPAKTKDAFNDRGWSSLGDIGYVDHDGFVYLTDRASHMIISGGVNIYPQEVENELTLHPAVVDVAVIGVPNADFGEEVKAVVVAADPSAAGPALADELITYCRERLATFKCPVSVDFVDALPRLPTGKLLKRELRDRYARRDER